MALTLVLSSRIALPRASRLARPRGARPARPGHGLAVRVRAHDEADDVLPIFSGRLPEHDPEKLPRGPQLGGKTLGEELSLLHDAYVADEVDKDRELHEHLYSKNWQGDVYVGSRWNILTVLMGLSFAVPLLGLAFAAASYGTLWTGHYYGV
ncbi:hypothetical protein HT031_002643 [Scenedesmus sp. PABB004]|nr:hypothetical protein HT031_002643 [Scenedesmus sp. PABB004]